MTSEQLSAYITIFRVEEIGQKLRVPDAGESTANAWNRCPSPEPEYNNAGQRINTREKRYRKHLEDEQHSLIESAFRTIPGYTPPIDYRRPAKFTDKVFIPTRDYPQINFIGQILGPRGSSLNTIAQMTGAKIFIRGKGSVKEGRSRKTGSQTADQNTGPLHCLIVADSQSQVSKAINAIKQIIENAVSMPESQNERKIQQLRALAEANGTLRDDENLSGRKNLTTWKVKSFGTTESTQASIARLGYSDQMDHQLEEEYKRLLADIQGGEASDASMVKAEEKRMPPWRMDRLRMKST